MSQKYKHMKLDDRIEIQECLNRGMSVKAIAQRIGKDQTTVSNEQNERIKSTDNKQKANDYSFC